MSVSTIIREANLMRTNPSAAEVYTVTETIDPSMAALYLERNEVNRPVRDAHVRKLVRAMKEGSFQQTHQGIAFSKSGQLLDGQHRLWAIIEYGDSIKLQVTYNLDEDAMFGIDLDSRPRSVADQLGFCDPDNWPQRRRSQAKSTIKVWMELIAGKRIINPIVNDFREFFEKHGEAVIWAVDLGGNHNNTRHSTVLALMALGYEKGYGDELADWCSIVKDGIITESWHTSALKFRDWRMASDGRRINSLSDRTVACRKAFCSMCAFIEMRPLGRIHQKEIGWLL